MTRYRPPYIANKDDVRRKLGDDKFTEFERLLKARVTDTAISQLLGPHRNTIRKYRLAYEGKRL